MFSIFTPLSESSLVTWLSIEGMFLWNTHTLEQPAALGEDRAGKVRLYAQAKEFRRRFQEVFGLTRCGDLLRARPGVTERNPASQRLGVTAHCDNMIVTAVEILEQMLQEEPA